MLTLKPKLYLQLAYVNSSRLRNGEEIELLSRINWQEVLLHPVKVVERAMKEKYPQRFTFTLI